MIKVAERLCQLRKERRLTQKDIAAYLGITLRTYQYYEGDGHRPELETLDTLAEYYGVSMDYLVGRSDVR